MNQARLTMRWILGAIAAVIVVAAVVAGSYHTTIDVGANLRAAGIDLQNMHRWAPPAKSAG